MSAPASRPAPRVPEPGAGPRPRVALVLSHLGPGGAERVASSLARHWSRTHDVALVTLGSAAADVYELPPAVDRIALDLLRPSRNVAEGALQASRRVLALRRALLRLAPDAVVSFVDRTNVLVLLAVAGTGLPVFVSERTDPRERRIGLWDPLRRVLYPRAAGVVMQTEGVAAWARAFCPRVHVIPNFVEPPARLASPGREDGSHGIVGVGRLVPEKGFDRLVEAFARVATAHPGWTLTLVGEGPERPRLEALAAARGLADRVFLPGHTRDVGASLAAAQVFALTSRFEGFPNALIEAMACGLPVVSFDCPSGPGEIIDHDRNGLLVAPGDVAGLAAALDRLLGSPAQRARLGAAAREIAVRLAPEVVLERWSALLPKAKELP